MAQLFKKKTGGGNNPTFPKTSLLDTVDWAYKILYGSESGRLLAIFEAKGSNSVDALPSLLQASLSSGESAIESKEAAEVIIINNSANRDILALVPDLVKKLPDPRVMWVFTAIAEANPLANECRKAVPVLVRLLDNYNKLDDEGLRDILSSLGRLGGQTEAESIKRFIQSGRPQHGSDLWNTAMSSLRRLEPQ